MERSGRLYLPLGRQREQKQIPHDPELENEQIFNAIGSNFATELPTFALIVFTSHRHSNPNSVQF